MSRWIGGDVKPNGNDRFTKVLLHLDGNFNDDNFGGGSHTWGRVVGGGPDANGTAKFGSASLNITNLATNPIVAITTPANTDFALGSGDWTVDFWVNVPTGSIRDGAPIAGQNQVAGTLAWQIATQGSTPGYIAIGAVRFGGVNKIVTGTTIAAADTFNHVEMARSGSSLLIFMNGNLDATTAVSGSVDTTIGPLSVGRSGNNNTGNGFFGLVDEFRISIGVARHTSNFTPPTRAYTRFLGSSS